MKYIGPNISFIFTKIKELLNSHNTDNSAHSELFKSWKRLRNPNNADIADALAATYKNGIGDVLVEVKDDTTFALEDIKLFFRPASFKLISANDSLYEGIYITMDGTQGRYVAKTFADSEIMTPEGPSTISTPSELALYPAASDAVLYTPQTLTEAQQKQARDNIGALDVNVGTTPVDIDVTLFGRGENIVYVKDGWLRPCPTDADTELVKAYRRLAVQIGGQSTEPIPTAILATASGIYLLYQNGLTSANAKIMPTLLNENRYAIWTISTNNSKHYVSFSVYGVAYSHFCKYCVEDNALVDENFSRAIYSTSTGVGAQTNVKQFRMSANPTEDMHIATKQYVDTAKTEAQQLGLTAATPGQIIKVKTVQDGKPTEWEAVDDRLPKVSVSDAGNVLGVEQIGEHEYGYALTHMPTLNDFIPLGITNASPGQFAKVSFVDDFGNPTAWEAADIYEKPDTGIPKSDLADDVKASLVKADTAISYNSQTLTEEQKSQARTNIGAGQPVFVVNVTATSDDNYTADKTAAEIEAAYQAGRTIVCRMTWWLGGIGIPVELPLVSRKQERFFAFAVDQLVIGKGISAIAVNISDSEVKVFPGGMEIYGKPADGIPKSDLAADVQTSLDNAMQQDGGTYSNYIKAATTNGVRLLQNEMWVGSPGAGKCVNIDKTGIGIYGESGTLGLYADASRIHNLVTPSDDADAANKQYVDAAKIEAQQLGLTSATPGQIIKVKTVQDGKPTEWEAVDMPSQPDWNQNDNTKPDYIKNRPFYTGNPVETVLVEESTVTFAAVDSMYMGQLESTFSATIGETYKVSWDGAAYECTCVSFNGEHAIGNLSIVSAGSDTGEPFIIGIRNGVAIQIVTADTSASHTFSISGFVTEVVKIDAKYLPNTVATKSEVEAAQTTAENAQTTAENAQTTADNAQTTANNAQTTANAALPKAGGNMTGSLVLKADPTAKMEAATKQYVDANKFTGEYKRRSDNKVVGINNFQYSSNVAEFYYRATANQGTTRCDYYLGLHGKANLSILCFQEGHIEISVSRGEAGAEQNIVFTNGNKSYGYGGVNISGIEGITMFSSSSSGPGRKKFRITVDDNGVPTITDESDSTNTWKPTNLPTVTSSDSGKFLRVSDTGKWVAETILSAYEKPDTGIPKSDLEQSVQTSLAKADTAISYNSQTLTEAQQAQARANIGAVNCRVEGNRLILTT